MNSDWDRTIAVKKEALARIGGYQALGDYFANDFMIGHLIERSRLSRRAFTICHRACGQSEEFSSHVDNQFAVANIHAAIRLRIGISLAAA